MHHRRILEQNYSYLAEHVMVPLLLTYLRDSGFLTNDLVQYVLQPDPRPDKVHRLVDIMTVFGKKSLNLLKDALRRSDQGYIADMLVCRDEEAFEPGGRNVSALSPTGMAPFPPDTLGLILLQGHGSFACHYV